MGHGVSGLVWVAGIQHQMESADRREGGVDTKNRRQVALSKAIGQDGLGKNTGLDINQDLKSKVLTRTGRTTTAPKHRATRASGHNCTGKLKVTSTSADPP